MSNPSGPIRSSWCSVKLSQPDYDHLTGIKERLEEALVKAEGVIEWTEGLRANDIMLDRLKHAENEHNKLSGYLGLKKKYIEQEDEYE